MKKKKVISNLFIFSAIFLAVFPVLLVFNEVLTKLVQSLQLYQWLQDILVPVETKMIGVLIYPLHLNYAPVAGGIAINGSLAQVTWNCLGWQSLLLLGITFLVGLSGKYTLTSKVETILIGIVGTFLVNLARLTFIVILLGLSKPIFKLVYHDYLAAVVTIIWLIGFWWFAQKYVLEDKAEILQEDAVKV